MKKVISYFLFVFIVTVFSSSCQLTGDSIITPSNDSQLAGGPSDGEDPPREEPD